MDAVMHGQGGSSLDGELAMCAVHRGQCCTPDKGGRRTGRSTPETATPSGVAKGAGATTSYTHTQRCGMSGAAAAKHIFQRRHAKNDQEAGNVAG